MAQRTKIESLRSLYLRSIDPASAAEEKRMATAVLAGRLKAMNLTIEDLIEQTEPRQIYWYPWKTKEERRVLVHIGAAVTDTDVSWNRGKRHIVGFKMNKAEHADFDVMFELYLRLWRQELEDLFVAFVNKHHLFPPTPSDKEQTPMTPEEINAFLNRLRALRDANDPRSTKRLGDGK